MRIFKSAGWFLINALQAVFFIGWSIAWMGAAVVLRLVTGDAERALAMARWGYSPGCLKATGARFVVDPLPDIDWSRPYAVVMNHQSMLDIPCAQVGLPVNLRFVAKHTLQYVPFLGWYMWATGMVFVDRSNRAQAVQSLSRAAARVREGATVIAFPEGTRARDGVIQPFKKGPFMLAIESGVPILPVAIHGSGRVLPSDSFKLRPGTVRLRVGQPIPTAGRQHERDQIIREARQAIIRMNVEMGGPGGVPQDIAGGRERDEARAAA